MPRTEVRTPRQGRAAALIVMLCWVVVVFDGYDLIVYGTVLPELIKDPAWGLTSSTAGMLGSPAFLGMLLGALGAGVISDRIGRRYAVLACTAWFSVSTVLCAVAWDPVSFGLSGSWRGGGWAVWCHRPTRWPRSSCRRACGRWSPR